MIIFVGQTPMFYVSKRHGAIKMFAYGAEFATMQSAVEEVISVWYIHWALGVKITRAFLLAGDNMSVIQNETIKDILLNKKHIAFLCHKIREVAAPRIMHLMKTS